MTRKVVVMTCRGILLKSYLDHEGEHKPHVHVAESRGVQPVTRDNTELATYFDGPVTFGVDGPTCAKSGNKSQPWHARGKRRRQSEVLRLDLFKIVHPTPYTLHRKTHHLDLSAASARE